MFDMITPCFFAQLTDKTPFLTPHFGLISGQPTVYACSFHLMFPDSFSTKTPDTDPHVYPLSSLTLTATAYGDVGDPSLGIDGDRDTARMYVGSPAKGAWLQLDLGEEVHVSTKFLQKT